MPFDGMGHDEQDVGPHESTDELLAQAPLHSWVLPWHLHAPPWQLFPAPQANDGPQPPQLLLSACSSTHAPPHAV
jgi:hypothetical protein